MPDLVILLPLLTALDILLSGWGEIFVFGEALRLGAIFQESALNL